MTSAPALTALSKPSSLLSIADVATTAGLLPQVPSYTPQAGVNILTVGAGQQFSTIAAAVAAAHDGDLILVQAGTYVNDFVTVTAKITLVGVGGMVNMVATVPPPNLKAIMLVDNDVNVQNFSFAGCAIPDASGGNGAGMRIEAGAVNLYNCAFIHNQDGILGGPVYGTPQALVIDHCVFSQNGSGTGYTHNVYLGNWASVTVTNSVFEGANVGHDFKSRASVNYLTNNIFRDVYSDFTGTGSGTASYNIDLPNGGQDTIINNIIEKGPNAENVSMIHFGGEGIPYAGSSLLVQGNKFVDDMGPQALGILNQTSISATVTGNNFGTLDPNKLISGPGTLTSNVTGSGTALPDSTLTGVLPGSTLVFTDSADHVVNLDGTYYNGSMLQAVQGAAGHLTVKASIGHVVVIGGSGGLNFTETGQSGGNSITTKAGSVNCITLGGLGQDLVDSEGTDWIIGGTGNLSANINGTATVTGGTGVDGYTVGGTLDLTGQGGSTTVTNNTPEATSSITGSLSYLKLTTNGGDASFDITQGGTEEAMSITGGAVSVVVYQQLIQVTTASGSQGATLTLGAGNASIMSQGADTIYAGSGNNTVIVSGAANIYAGTGSLAVFGRGDTQGANVYASSDPNANRQYVLDGDTGNIVYFGGTLANTVIDRLGNVILVGGAGQMTVIGGNASYFFGGSGGMVLNEGTTGGGNNITTAAGSTNKLVLNGNDTVNSWGADTITLGSGGNTIVTAHGGAMITGGISNQIRVQGGTNTFVSTGGIDRISATGGGGVYVTATANTIVTETGGWASYKIALPPVVRGVTSYAMVTASGGSATLSAHSGGGVDIATTQGSSSTVTVNAGPAYVTTYGADTVQLTGGAATVNVVATGATIRAGSGTATIHQQDSHTGSAVTVYGGAGALTYDQGYDALTFYGGSGSASINATMGTVAATGGSGALSITAGSQGMTFIGGSGTANIKMGNGVWWDSTHAGNGEVTFGAGITTVTQGNVGGAYAGAAVYDFVAGIGGGTDIINGFRAGTDKLVLHTGINLVSKSVDAAGVHALLSDNTHLTLAGLTTTQGLAFSHAA